MVQICGHKDLKVVHKVKAHKNIKYNKLNVLDFCWMLSFEGVVGEMPVRVQVPPPAHKHSAKQDAFFLLNIYKC